MSVPAHRKRLPSGRAGRRCAREPQLRRHGWWPLRRRLFGCTHSRAELLLVHLCTQQFALQLVVERPRDGSRCDLVIPRIADSSEDGARLAFNQHRRSVHVRSAHTRSQAHDGWRLPGRLPARDHDSSKGTGRCHRPSTRRVDRDARCSMLLNRRQRGWIHSGTERCAVVVVEHDFLPGSHSWIKLIVEGLGFQPSFT